MYNLKLIKTILKQFYQNVQDSITKEEPKGNSNKRRNPVVVTRKKLSYLSKISSRRTSTVTYFSRFTVQVQKVTDTPRFVELLFGEKSRSEVETGTLEDIQNLVVGQTRRGIATEDVQSDIQN